MKITLIAVILSAGFAHAQSWMVADSSDLGTIDGDYIFIVDWYTQNLDPIDLTNSTTFSSPSDYPGDAGLAQTTSDAVGMFEFNDTGVDNYYIFAFRPINGTPDDGLSEDTYFHFNAGDAVGGAGALSFSAGTLISFQESTTGDPLNYGGGTLLLPAGTTDLVITRTTDGADTWYGTFSRPIPEPSSTFLIGISSLVLLARRKR